MSLDTLGLSLFEAARRVGVSFQREVEPQDKELTLGGLKLHYLDWGNEEKEPLIFLHGNSQQSHSWDFISLSLCDSYHVIAPDARGHGNSDWAPDQDYRLDAHLQDLGGLVDALGLDRFLLVGHSMGGRTSYVYTSQEPDRVKALVIVDSGPQPMHRGAARMDRFKHLPDELDSYEEFAQRVQEYTGRPRWQVLGALKYTIRQLPSGKWTWKYDKVFRTPGAAPPPSSPERLWECLPRIACPTLIVRGAESDVFAPETMARMLELIPQSTSVTIPQAGHLVAGDNPTDFVEALKTWLDGLP